MGHLKYLVYDFKSGILKPVTALLTVSASTFTCRDLKKDFIFSSAQKLFFLKAV